MPAATHLRHRSRTLLIAATVPLALAAAVVDDVRVRRQLDAARRDPLTGLPGRHGLTAHATKTLASRHRHQLLLVMCDGNGFKQINDRFGHAAGDQVVITLAHRLRQWATAHRGVAARLGGDESAALVHLPRHTADRELTALRAHMNRPVPHQDLQLPFTVSIGAAHTTDLPGHDYSALLHAADVAMYRVKTGTATFPHLATGQDATLAPVNGRRPGRPGTHTPGRVL
ncbi:GGDEF domain-containing protein [Actinacidiphila glaucinigra]|uniref:GGDEF domain-containing protein n=1 Tax=Actinacidiphila glaucinigra TaxID=235986 RepID=UPI0035D95A78